MGILGRNISWKRSPGTLAYGTDDTVTLANGNMRYFGFDLPMVFDNDSTVGVDLARAIQRITVRSVHGELLILEGASFVDFCRLGSGICITGGNLATNDDLPNYVTAATPAPFSEYHDFATEVTADHQVGIACLLELNSLPSSNIGCEITWNANAAWFQSTTFTTAPSGTIRCLQGFSPEAPDSLIWYRGRSHIGITTTEVSSTIPSARKNARVLWVTWSNRPAITADVTTVIPFALGGQELRIEKAAAVICHVQERMGAAIACSLNEADVTQMKQGVSLGPEALTDDDLVYFYTNNTGLTRNLYIAAMQITGL